MSGMLRGKRPIHVIAAVAVLLGLLLPFVLRRTHVFYTDGGGVREPESSAQPALRDVLWAPPVAVPDEGVNLHGEDRYEPRVSPDGDVLVFTRGRPGENTDLWIAERRRGRWDAARPFAPLNSPADDLGAAFTPDGNAVLFYSNRPGGQGGFDLWASRRDGDEWSAPENLGPAVNSGWHELSPALGPDGGPDGGRLYFASDRRDGVIPSIPWEATVRETLRDADYDLYAADLDPSSLAPLGPPRLLEAVSARGSAEGCLAVSPAGDFLYFASNRESGEGGFDLYRARLAGGVPGPPRPLGPPVNSSADELDPALTAGGFGLYFARAAAGRDAIYVTSSREVYLETETGDTYWSLAAVLAFLRDLIALIPPPILALIVSIILCLLFWLLFRRRYARLSLLARSFLIALLVHLVAALWMNTNRVQRLLLKAFPPEESFDAFEVSVEGSHEEAVGAAIREALAETGGDELPELEPAPRWRESAEDLERPPLAAEAPAVLEDVLEAPAEIPRAFADAADLDTELEEPPALRVAAAASGVEPPDGHAEIEPPELSERRVAAPREEEPPAALLLAPARGGAGVLPADEPRADVPPLAASAALRPLVPASSLESGAELEVPERAPPAALSPRPPLEAALPGEGLAEAEPAPPPLPLRRGAVEAPPPAPSAPSESSEGVRLVVEAPRRSTTPPLPEEAAPPALEEALGVVQREPEAVVLPAPPALTPRAPRAPRDLEARAAAAAGPDEGPLRLPLPEAQAAADPPELAPRSAEAPSHVEPSPREPALALSARREVAALAAPPTPSSPAELAAPSAVEALLREGLAAPAPAVAVLPGVAGLPAAPERAFPPPRERTAAPLALEIAGALPSRPPADPERAPLATPAAATGPAPQPPPPPESLARAAQGETGETRLAPRRASVLGRPPPREGALEDAARAEGAERSPLARADAYLLESERAPPPPGAPRAAPRTTSPRGLDLGEREAPPRRAAAPRTPGGDPGPPPDLARAAPQGAAAPEGAASPAPAPAARAAAGRLEPRRRALSEGAASVPSDPPTPAGRGGLEGGVRAGPPAPPAGPSPEEPERSVRPIAIVAPRERPLADPLRPAASATTFVPKLYQLREKSRREETLRRRGGSALTERAVERGLAWLARHQSPDGRWSLRSYTEHLRDVSRRDLEHPDWDGRGRSDSRGGSDKARDGDTAGTGLALLSFLGHGDTHLEPGPYKETVAGGIDWLLSRQRSDGDLRGGGNLYMHAIAAFALCEAYAFTRDPKLRGPAQKAIDFTARSQNPQRGGWRYAPYPQASDVDTSVFGWMLMALKSARLGGLDLDEECLARAAKYLESARMSKDGGRYAYQPGNSRTSLAMTAQGFFSQQILANELLAGGATRERLRRATGESVRYLLSHLPKAADQEGVNFYYWYYATLALSQEGGEAWDAWNEKMSRLLVLLQVGDEHGSAAGSWDPRDRRAAIGGRVYSTAMSILCLESYYRYAPLEEPERAERPPEEE